VRGNMRKLWDALKSLTAGWLHYVVLAIASFLILAVAALFIG